MEPAEAACDLPAQDTGQPGVAVQVDTAPMSGLVCMDMGGHLSFNLKDVTGKVDKYLTCVGWLEAVMYAGEQLGAQHVLHVVQMAGQGRLGKEIFFSCLCQALFIHNGNDVFKQLGIQVEFRRRIMGRMGADCGLGWGGGAGLRRVVLVHNPKQLLCLCTGDGLVTGIG